jgi:uncharacterized membrane protein YgcG
MWFCVAFADTPASFPRPPAGVLDDAHLLTPDEVGALEAAVAGAPVAVVTVERAEPSPELFADALRAAWFPGEPALVVVLSTRDRRLVTRASPDLLDERWLAVMQQESMVPRLQQGDVGGALLAGVVRARDQLASAGDWTWSWVVLGGGLVAAAVVAMDRRT